MGFAGRRAEAIALLREILVAMAGCVTVRGQLTGWKVVVETEMPYSVGNDASSIGSEMLGGLADVWNCRY